VPALTDGPGQPCEGAGCALVLDAFCDHGDAQGLGHFVNGGDESPVGGVVNDATDVCPVELHFGER
jgi:hypothetical protein